MEANARQRTSEAQKRLESAIRQIVNCTGELLEPLKRLKAEQRDAIAILGIMMQGISYTNRPQLKIDDAVVQQFKQELEQIVQGTGWAVQQYIDTDGAGYFLILEKD